MMRETNNRSSLIQRNSEQGFTLVELVIASMILIAVGVAAFALLSEVQHKAGFQMETLTAWNNARLAFETMERHIRQAGNDPLGAGFAGVAIIGPGEVRLRTDVKGSTGPSHPDKGDPDGDTGDSYENVRIRYNPASRSIELASADGPPQTIANHISDLSFQYYNELGEVAAPGDAVAGIRISVSGCSMFPNPRTRRWFSVRVEGMVNIWG